MTDENTSPRGYPLAPTGGEDGRPMTAFEAQSFYERLVDIVADIGLDMGDGRLIIGRDKRSVGGRFYLQVEVTRRDIMTGKMGTGRGGKTCLSPSQTNSELIQCACNLWIGYWSHEARETFLYRGRRVFGPHIDVNAHWGVAETLDARGPRPATDPVGDLLDFLRTEAKDSETNASHAAIEAGMNGDPTDGGMSGLMMASQAYLDAASITESEVDPVPVLRARAAAMRDQASQTQEFLDAHCAAHPERQRADHPLDADERRVSEVFARAAADLEKALRTSQADARAAAADPVGDLLASLDAEAQRLDAEVDEACKNATTSNGPLSEAMDPPLFAAAAHRRAAQIIKDENDPVATLRSHADAMWVKARVAEDALRVRLAGRAPLVSKDAPEPPVGARERRSAAVFTQAADALERILAGTQAA